MSGRQLDAAHLAAAFHMRAAAGTDIHIRYRHDSYRARQLLFAAVVQLRQLRRRGPSYRHGRVLPYHPVGSAFHIGQLRIGERTGKIHRYILRADMKAHIVVAELSVYDAADDMLARVLLHVIQPAAAVHITLDHLSHTQRCCDRMHHYTVLFVHIQNARTAQGSPVRRLASALGIKCRGVQRYGKIAVRGHAAQHSSAEL